MKYISRFEKIVIVILVVMMSLLLLLAIVNAGYQFFKILGSAPADIFNEDNIKKLFGMILLVIVGLELLDTIKVYLKEDVVHAEVVILAAIIGLANKVIVLDLKQTPAETVIALAGLMIALGVTYYLLKEKLTISINKKKTEQSEADQTGSSEKPS